MRVALGLLAIACTHSPGVDAGPPVKDAASDSSCLASSISGFQPSAWVPPRPARSACSADELDTYWNVCVQLSALPIQCQQFIANHPDCAACLSTESADGGAGPLLARAGVVDVNVGGCIALGLGDNRPDGCGAREQSARECAAFACADCVDGGTCPTAARQGVCADYQMHTCAELAGAAPCTLVNGPLEDYRRIAAVFCSAGATSDAGH